MKTIKLSLIGVFLFSSMFTNADARATNTVDSITNELRQELMKMIQNPNLKGNGISEAEIQLQFTISQTGEIQLLQIKAKNEYLKEFVMQKLDKQKVNLKNIQQDMVYHLTVRFELV